MQTSPNPSLRERAAAARCAPRAPHAPRQKESRADIPLFEVRTNYGSVLRSFAGVQLSTEIRNAKRKVRLYIITSRFSRKVGELCDGFAPPLLPPPPQGGAGVRPRPRHLRSAQQPPGGHRHRHTRGARAMLHASTPSNAFCVWFVEANHTVRFIYLHCLQYEVNRIAQSSSELRKEII